MTPVQVTQGFAANERFEAVPGEVGYEMTYYHEAPLAVATANAKGSNLVAVSDAQFKDRILFGEIIHVAENMYCQDTVIIDCQPGEITDTQVGEAFRLADADRSQSGKLIILNGLDELIGTGMDEPTKLEKFALNTLLRWTNGNVTYPGGIRSTSASAKRNICATMKHFDPEEFMHPLRAQLISSFVGKQSLIGSAPKLSLVPEPSASAKNRFEVTNQVVAA